MRLWFLQPAASGFKGPSCPTLGSNPVPSQLGLSQSPPRAPGLQACRLNSLHSLSLEAREYFNCISLILCLMLVVPLSLELNEGWAGSGTIFLTFGCPCYLHTALGWDDTDIKCDENVPVSAAGFGIPTGQELSCLMKICGLAGWWCGREVEGSLLGDGWQEPGHLNSSAFKRNKKCLRRWAGEFDIWRMEPWVWK